MVFDERWRERVGCGIRRDDRCRVEKLSKPAESVSASVGVEVVAVVVGAVEADTKGSYSCAGVREVGERKREPPGVGCGEGAEAADVREFPAPAPPLPPALKVVAMGLPKAKPILLLFSITVCRSAFAFSFARSSAIRSLYVFRGRSDGDVARVFTAL